MKLSPELVCEWIDAFPITVHVTAQVDCIYSANVPYQFAQKQHKEEPRICECGGFPVDCRADGRMLQCSLPGGFSAPISCPIKTMRDAMKSKRTPDKPAIDLENIFVLA